MKKERFVNEAVLLRNLPVFLCGGKKTEAQLDRLIDLIEENLIIEKAAEIEGRRRAAIEHECSTDPDGQCTVCSKQY